jgi:hypothetical protein
MWKQLLLILALTGAIAPAYATDYTDIWWIPTESGWGVNFVQSDNFLFATMFVYGADGTPTWVSAEMTRTARGSYFGPVFANTGPYFASATYNPSLVTSPQVGTATFRPTGPATGEFDYSVLGVFVSKGIQRQSLVSAALGGAYLGGHRTLVTGCEFPEQDGVTYLYAQFFVDTFAPSQIQIEIPSDSGLLCRLTGTVVQQGTVNEVTDATYTCNDGLRVTSTISELKSTSLGIEGRWLASVGQGCKQDVTFSGVRK